MSATVTCARCPFEFVAPTPKDAALILAQHQKERHDLGSSEEERQELKRLLR